MFRKMFVHSTILTPQRLSRLNVGIQSIDIIGFVQAWKRMTEAICKLYAVSIDLSAGAEPHCWYGTFSIPHFPFPFLHLPCGFHTK